jgi:hypothetical protein
MSKIEPTYPAVRWFGVPRRICPTCAARFIKAKMLVEDPSDKVPGLAMFKLGEGITVEDLRTAAQVHHVNGESSG